MSTPAAPSKTFLGPMAIVPRLGASSPATARKSVVFPLPEGPSSETTSPRSSSIDTPFRIGLSPYARCRSWTVSSAMIFVHVHLCLVAQLDAETQRKGEPDAHQHDVDERERRHDVDRAAL